MFGFTGKIIQILSAAAVLVVIGVIVVFASFSIMGPKDLGVTYTHEDYQNALAKTGIQIEFEGMTGDELEGYKMNAEPKSFHDYDFEFSDYQHKEFTLSNSEATALLNEIAPGFWWFDDLQVKVNPDGSMEGSSKADIKRLKHDLYSDVADDVPLPLPDRLNIYSKGHTTIENNQLNFNPDSFYLGSAPLPGRYLEDDSVRTMEQYLPRIYEVVPGLEIRSLDANDDGEFVFDGVIPQKVTVNKKA